MRYYSSKILRGRGTDLEVGKVGLLVELGRLETERVDDIVDGNGTVLNTLVLLLGGGVGT